MTSISFYTIYLGKLFVHLFSLIYWFYIYDCIRNMFIYFMLTVATSRQHGSSSISDAIQSADWGNPFYTLQVYFGRIKLPGRSFMLLPFSEINLTADSTTRRIFYNKNGWHKILCGLRTDVSDCTACYYRRNELI